MDYKWCGPVCGGVGREQRGWSVRCGKSWAIDHSPPALHSLLPQAPSSGLVNCRVQHAGSSYSSFCNGDLQHQYGRAAHITAWGHSSQAAAGLSQPGVAGAAAALDDGAAANGAWNAVYGRHRQRQQHRVAVAPQACEVYLMRMLLSVAL